MKIRLVYCKLAEAKYVAHLDLTRFFTRALRRAGVDVARSQGFNPHARISFGPPLAVGAEGLAEYVDVEINDTPRLPDPVAAVRALRREMPPTIRVLDFRTLPPGAPALTAVIDLACYLVFVPLTAARPEAEVEAGLTAWLRQPEILVTKRKGGAAPVTKNIRPFISRLSLRRAAAGAAAPADGGGADAAAEEAASAAATEPGLELDLEIKMTAAGSAKAADVIESLCEFLALPWDKNGVTITRTALFCQGDKRRSPLEV
ncbi:MAG: TIGR03936 family radical SAM-associated protein [Gracilibacteraceae bacterium]|jgi:radical SAM-linked protein|nr:TIGR03936 family radical SAM-associated protein [Gracilibacteraceae bacterium]